MIYHLEALGRAVLPTTLLDLLGGDVVCLAGLAEPSRSHGVMSQSLVWLVGGFVGWLVG